jgi:hypothetical protein
MLTSWKLHLLDISHLITCLNMTWSYSVEGPETLAEMNLKVGFADWKSLLKGQVTPMLSYSKPLSDMTSLFPHVSTLKWDFSTRGCEVWWLHSIVLRSLVYPQRENTIPDMQIFYSNKTIATSNSIKFLGLTLNTTLNWKHLISELIPRLNTACYAIRSIKPFMSLNVLRSTYFSYAHSIMS